MPQIAVQTHPAIHQRARRLGALWATILLCLTPCLAIPQTQPAAEPAVKSAPEPDKELQESVEKIQKLSARLAPIRREVLKRSPDHYALAMLKIEKAQLAQRSRYLENRRGLLLENLDEAAGILEALVEGREPSLPTLGLIERAYVSPSDLSTQPYVLYVPKLYEPGEKFGLVIFLHGYVSYLNKLNWVEMMFPEVLGELAEKARCVAVLPYARSNTDFQGIGEDDVMHVLDKVVRDFELDRSRIFLSGVSMGGMGVWTIGAHYPHRFAALVPISARGDFYMWKKIDRESLPPFKRKLVDTEFGAELVPNYRNLPALIIHPTSDSLVTVEQARRMGSLLKEHGFPVNLVEMEDVDHWSWSAMLSRPELFTLLKEKKRNEAPSYFTFRTSTLKYSQAYWAQILGIENWGEPAEFACKLERTGLISVTSRNATELRLTPPAGFAGDRGVEVVWNGKSSVHRIDEQADIRLGGPVDKDAKLAKTPSLCGPIREAFAGPFVMVYGDSQDEQAKKRAVRAGMDWLLFSQGAPSVLPDSRVTEKLIASCNLILFGTPEGNEIIKRIMPELPIKIRNGSYHVGTRSYDASQFGLSMIYPNPLNPKRYVVVNSGPVWGKGLARNHKYDMLPDFIVFTEEASNDGTDASMFVCAGFFDQHWRLSEKSTWHSEEPR